MTEERLSFVWLTLTILILITLYIFGKAWDSLESKIVFIFFGVLLVITTYLLLQNKSRKAKKNEQDFLQKLLETREFEKKKIASELHDSIQQNLHSINFELYRIAKNYPPVKWKIEEMTERINQTISDIRTISSDLFPHQLEKLGLKKSIEAMANNLTYSTNVFFDTKISNDINDLYSDEVSLNIYRIIQELTNNIVKHSNASKAIIEMYVDGPFTYITVWDDGKGLKINLKKLDSFREGLGISSIHQRLKLIGGSLNVYSEIDKGTKFKINIPVKKYL